MTIKVLKTFVPGGAIRVYKDRNTARPNHVAVARSGSGNIVAHCEHKTRDGAKRMLFGALYERDRVDRGESE